MERQNVTLSLPKSLLKKAKVLAAKKEKSLSQILKEAIEEKVMEDSGYEKARERQLRLLRTGLNLGTHGRVSYSREDLHARE
jgi:predicted transcriptional regulator